MIIVQLQEQHLTSEMYLNPLLYNRLGKGFCIAYDVGLGKDGSEAIVESLYSVMKSLSLHGHQANRVLVDRTCIDWHCPISPLGIIHVIEEAAKLHLEKRNAPISKINFGMSKVMKRLKGDRGRIP